MQESNKYFQEITFQSMDHSYKCSVLLLHISSVTRSRTLRTLAVVSDVFLFGTWGQGAAVLGLALHEGQPTQSGEPEQTCLTSASAPDSPGASPCGLCQEQAKRQIRLCWDSQMLDTAGQTGKNMNPASCQACIASALFFAGILPSSVQALEARKDTMLPPNLLLLTLKWDLPMVCFTMLGVTLHIFHRSSFLCSQGSFSTKKAKS